MLGRHGEEQLLEGRQGGLEGVRSRAGARNGVGAKE
jgi:hypothetical protein